MTAHNLTRSDGDSGRTVDDQPLGGRSTSQGRDQADSGPPGPERWWTVPVLHHIVLACVLFLLLAFAGTDAVWSADEGALLYQVSSLAEDGEWSFAHPFPAGDPEGTRYPLHLSSWAVDPGDPGDPSCPTEGEGCRYIALAKHTAFLWLVTSLFSIGGYQALLVFSTLGTLVAAVATSRLARRIEPSAELPTLWLVGLGSPLFFNSYVAWAHSPAAALVAVAALLLMTSGERNRGGSRLRIVLGLAALAGACFLRTEAPFAGFALGFGWLGLWLFSRRGADTGAADDPAVGPFVGILTVTVTVAATLVDRLTAHPTLGPVEPPSFDEAFGLIGGRLEGFANTWLKPGYVTVRDDLFLLVSAAALIVAAVFFRRGPDGRSMAKPAAVLAIGCLAIRFVVMPVALIPGLIVACPLLIVGLIVLDRGSIRDRHLQAIVVPFVLFCGAVLTTQYRGGGGGEWGGRYFAVGLPFGLAVAGVGLVRARRLVPTADRRLLTGLLLAGPLLLNTLGLFGLREIRDRTSELAATIETTAVDASDGNSRPVVVTTMNGLGRWLWEDLDSMRLLRVPSDDLPTTATRLADLGVARFTVVTLRPDEDLELLAEWYLPVPEAEADKRTIAGSVIALERR